MTMKRLHHLFLIAALAPWMLAALLPATAIAAEVAGDGIVRVPYGDLLAAASGMLVNLALAGLAAALSFLPASVVTLIRTWRINQLMERGLAYGINAVAGAAKGKELEFHTASKVLESALEYIVAHGSNALLDWAGPDYKTLRQKLISRMTLAPDAALQG